MKKVEEWINEHPIASNLLTFFPLQMAIWTILPSNTFHDWIHAGILAGAVNLVVRLVLFARILREAEENIRKMGY